MIIVCWNDIGSYFPVISKSKSLYSCPVSTSGVVPDFSFTFTGFFETGFRIQPPERVIGELGGGIPLSM